MLLPRFRDEPLGFLDWALLLPAFPPNPLLDFVQGWSLRSLTRLRLGELRQRRAVDEMLGDIANFVIAPHELQDAAGRHPA